MAFKCSKEIPGLVQCLPEAFLTYNRNLTYADVQKAYKSGQALCGKVTKATLHGRIFTVSLSDYVQAYLPFEQAIIQDFIDMTYTKSEDDIRIGHYASSLIGCNISVHVDSIGPEILLTRKPSLEKALKILSESFKNKNAVYSCVVLSCSSNSVFVDMGGGILGCIPIYNLSIVHYKDLRNWIHKGDRFFAKLYYAPSDLKITLSRKDYYANNGDSEQYHKGDILTVAVGQPLYSGDGYFVEITPGIAGIMDSDRKISEGTLLTATIHKVIPTPDKPCGYQFRLFQC